MEYLIVKQNSCGSCYVVEPNKLMTRQEAENLMALMSRVEPSYEYHMVKVVNE